MLYIICIRCSISMLSHSYNRSVSSFLILPDNNTFTAHPVKIGITDGSKTEIVSGITENTPVVTETVVKGAMPGMEEPSAGEGERSPFMPGPPGSNKKKNK